MVHLDPAGSRVDHEVTIAKYLSELDPHLGPLLAPYLTFDRLDGLTEQDRRRLRGEIAQLVRETLDSEDVSR